MGSFLGYEKYLQDNHDRFVFLESFAEVLESKGIHFYMKNMA